MHITHDDARGIADTDTRNIQSQAKKLQFVYSDKLARINPRDRRSIKSHAAKGSGRPRQSLLLKRPRIGTWIRDEPDKARLEMYIIRRMIIPGSLSNFPGLSELWIDKIFKCVGQLSQALYPTAFCSVFHIADTAWFMYLNQDPVHHYVYPYIAELYLVGQSAEAARMLSKLLPMVQASIEDSNRATTDSTISAVLALATSADISGDLTSLKKHVHGLSSLVKMRGGVPKLPHTELQIKCCRVDIQLALYTGSTPVFYADEISWEPFFINAGKSPGSKSKLDKSKDISSILGVIDSRLRDVWMDAREFCSLVNLAAMTGNKIRPRLFQETMVTLQYRLLHLGSQLSKLSRAIQVGMLVFTTTIFLHVAGIPTRYRWLTSRIREILKDFEQPDDIQGWKLRLWLLLTCLNSGLTGVSGNWLTPAISQALVELKLSEWLDVKTIMKEHLWIDVLHDSKAKNTIMYPKSKRSNI